MTSKCLICLVNLELDLVTHGNGKKSKFCTEKIVQTFRKFFCGQVENNWKFQHHVLPFCQNCQQLMVNLCALDSKVTQIEQKIHKIIANVAKQIIQSNFPNQNEETGIDKQNFGPQASTKLKSDPQPSVKNLTALLLSNQDKIIKTRDIVFKNYCPVVVLRNLNTTIPITRSTRRKILNLNSVSWTGASGRNIRSRIVHENDQRNGTKSQDESSRSIHSNPPSSTWNHTHAHDDPSEILGLGESPVSPDQDTNDSNFDLDDNEMEVDRDSDPDVVLRPSQSLKIRIRKKPLQFKNKKFNKPHRDKPTDKETFKRRKGKKVQNSLEISERVDSIYFGLWSIKQQDNEFLCQACGTVRKNKRSMLAHIKRLHEDSRTLKCQVCKEEMGTESEFIGHLTKVHSEVTLLGQVIPCGQDKFLYDGELFFYEKNGKFECIECGERELNEITILEHLKDHSCPDEESMDPSIPEDGNSKTVYNCKSCNLTFAYKSQMSDHESIVHSKMPRCKVCHKSFKLGQLAVHQSRGPCHEFLMMNKNLTCPLCGLHIVTIFYFTKHMTKMHPEVTLASDLVDCGQGNVMYDKRWLFVNMTELSGFQCHFCGERGIQNREEMQNHVESHPGFTCTECNKIYKLKSQLEAHKNKEHGDMGKGRFYFGKIRSKYYERLPDPDPDRRDKESFKCSACDHVGHSHTEMVQHLREHSNKMRKNSSLTPLEETIVLTSEGQYLYNGKWGYGKNVEGKFECATCGKTYKDTRGILFHVRTFHDDPTGFRCICDICGKGFHLQEHLDKHKFSHVDERLFQCQEFECGASFKSGLHLQQHIRTVHGPKSWLCEHCPKAFSAREHYARHVEIHSEVRGYKCPHCPKSYKQYAALGQHKKSAHSEDGEKPYQCHLCFMRFTQRQSVGRHMKNVHREGGKGSPSMKRSKGTSTTNSTSNVQIQQDFQGGE